MFASGIPYVEPNITIKKQRLKVVEKFTYLSSTLSKPKFMDNEVNTRLVKASAAFGRLNRNVWNRRGISKGTKSRYPELSLLSPPRYRCEMWTTYQQHIKNLNHFRTTCLRKILSITWQKHIPETKVLDRASLPSIYTILMQS